MLTPGLRYLLGLAGLLAAGGLLGWLLGIPVAGLLVATLMALIWHVGQMFVVERALRSGDFAQERYGSNFWSRAFAHVGRLQKRGQKHKRRYRRLLKEVRESTNAMPDGAIILSDAGEIVLCNPAAEALVGFGSRDDRGQRVEHLLRDPAFVQYLRAENFAEGVEIASPLRDGDWLYCRVVPYGEKQRLLLIRDVTERVRLNKMRRDFVANVSHELRSPLTVISGYLDTLTTDPEVPEDWRRPLGQMQSQAVRMTSIISELMELSRLETAGAAVEDEDVDVPAIIARVAQTYEDRTDAPAIQVDIQATAHLTGSAGEIESVISNLVSNAVRHTPAEGEVTVCWSANQAEAILSVRDTGEGIPADHVPRVTERFFRVDKGRARDDGGVGLGLAIVKYALSRHQGELEIDSVLDKGSTFTCRFPAVRVIALPQDDMFPASAGVADSGR